MDAAMEGVSLLSSKGGDYETMPTFRRRAPERVPVEQQLATSRQAVANSRGGWRCKRHPPPLYRFVSGLATSRYGQAPARCVSTFISCYFSLVSDNKGNLFFLVARKKGGGHEPRRYRPVAHRGYGYSGFVCNLPRVVIKIARGRPILDSNKVIYYDFLLSGS